MTYLSGKSKSRRTYIRYAFILATLALVVYFWGTLRPLFYPYIEPVVRGYSSTKGAMKFVPSFISTYFTTHKSLYDRNAQLEVTIERLENELASRDAFIREQELIKNAALPSSPSVIAMYPLAKDATKLYSTILLSKGYKDGVEKGGMVYVRGLQPVCMIVEVYDRTSLCELLSKGKRVTEAVTASGTVMLSLSGIGAGNFISELPKGINVSVGDEVYLRENQSLRLGSIVSISENEQSTGAKIYVRGMYNPVTSSIFYMNTQYAR
jgi:cell shape-determining protein MreC